MILRFLKYKDSLCFLIIFSVKTFYSKFLSVLAKNGKQMMRKPRRLFQITNMHEHEEGSGFDISTSPLAPASEFWEKRAFGQVHFSLHLPNGQANFLTTAHFLI